MANMRRLSSLVLFVLLASPGGASVRAGDTPVTLEWDVIPVLTRYGCNSGHCHGKARGQNGFQLSLLGFDPDLDYQTLVQEGRGRRVFPASPDHSLMLMKPTGRIPHGGGPVLELDSPSYRVLRRWISQGFPRATPDTPSVVRISVEPSERILRYGEEQELAVDAHYSDGRTEDVTRLATFQSSESPIVSVNEDGLLRAGPIPGEAAIMARYLGLIAICKTSIPLPGEIAAEVYENLPRSNLVDPPVWEKLERLRLTPSPPADPATILRRSYLDIIGRLPTADETRAYLTDSSADRHRRLVDRLLERPEYPDHWANKWVDLLRPNPYRVGIKAVMNLDAWIRDAFRRNLPYDEFARAILTAQGSTFRENAATVFRDRRSPDEVVTMMSQLFLGIRLGCAKCHHHPFEIWSQEDFYSLAAYFARVGRKGSGLSPPISGGEEIIFVADKGEVRHPRTNDVLPPRPLFGEAGEIGAGADPRAVLADCIVSPENPFFARVMVNRVWADIMGRGLVEPVDDLRETNPPSNEALLDALADSFREGSYDLKALIRTIVTSQVYGLSSEPGERNVADTRNYSRHYRQRIRAEALLDSICDIAERPETFAAMPAESRSTAIWTHRTGSIFLDTFGRPDPNQDPPCERIPETSVVQALHLMNSPKLHEKLTSDSGRAARMAAGELSDAEIAEEIYLTVYSRFPNEEEREICRKLFAESPGKDDLSRRRRSAEDLLWALVNTPEFVFEN